MENLRLNNGRSLRQKESNLVTQTDASKSCFGTHSRKLLHIKKSIWSCLFSKKIAMPAEYSPSALNVHADWESGSIKDNYEWELNVSVYQEIGTYMRKQTLDLFASKHCH